MSQQVGQKLGQETRPGQQQDQSMMQKAEEQASGLTQMARDGASHRAESQKNQIATRLSSVADAVDKVGQQLQQQDQGSLAHYANMASKQVRTVSDGLQQKDVNEVLHDAENAIRQRPALVLGGMFALGMVGARFLKSSPPETEHSMLDYQPSQQTPPRVTPPTTPTSTPPITRQ